MVGGGGLGGWSTGLVDKWAGGLRSSVRGRFVRNYHQLLNYTTPVVHTCDNANTLTNRRFALARGSALSVTTVRDYGIQSAPQT